MKITNKRNNNYTYGILNYFETKNHILQHYYYLLCVRILVVVSFFSLSSEVAHGRSKHTKNNPPINKQKHRNTKRSHLKSFVRELLVSPLFKFDVYSGVKGARVHCLGSW